MNKRTKYRAMARLANKGKVQIEADQKEELKKDRDNFFNQGVVSRVKVVYNYIPKGKGRYIFWGMLPIVVVATGWKLVKRLCFLDAVDMWSDKLSGAIKR